MDFIRQQLAIIQERLAGLSPSQKMLAGTLVVIMVMTLLYWGRFASDRDMVALFPNGISGEELVTVTNALTAKGITVDAAGGLVKVPADRQLEAIGAITYNESMPANSASALDAMFDRLSPLSTQGEVEARMHGVREQRLKQMMQTWDGVRSATVMITEGERGGLNALPSGVSINITTKSGANPKKLANAAVSSVIPLVSGLSRDAVTVIVDGTTITGAGASSGFASGELLEMKNHYEADAVQKIKRLYSRIQNLEVIVTADVDVQTKQEKINSIDPLNKLSLPTETVSETSTTTEPPQVGEPGTVPNTGVDATLVASAPAGGSRTERTEERNQNFVGTKETQISTPAGVATYASANIRVPREYFVQILKRKNKNAEPSDEQVDTLEREQLVTMRHEVMASLKIDDENKVTVAESIDVDPMTDPFAAPVATAGAGASLSLIATGHGKEVAIGALALTSLFMVSRMVKKSAPPAPEPMLALDGMPDISSGPRARSGKGTHLASGVDMAGEVTEGGSIMMGQELDEEVLETSQMVEQVSGFVKDNPDTTAQLLRRWMNRE